MEGENAVIAFFTIIFLGLFATWWLEAREENGAAEKASINRMADKSRKTASQPKKQRFTKYSQIGWTPTKRIGGTK